MSGAVGLRGWSFTVAWSTGSGPFLSTVKRRRRPNCLSLSYHCQQRRPAAASCDDSETSKQRSHKKVIVISGPTGAGKSRLALELAKRLDGEIISADSVQVYRGLDVGSAKPSVDERQQVPHHLIDILHPSGEYSAGQFFADARKATDEILGRQRVPIVVGGTGLYLRWYMYGKPDVPVATKQLSGEAHSELAHLERTGQWDAAVQLVAAAGDPKAPSLASNDWYRLRRSLEIIKSTGGSPPSAFAVPYDAFKQRRQSELLPGLHCHSQRRQQQQQVITTNPQSTGLDYEFICFFLSSPRVDLYRLIDFRCEEMLTAGILSEASRLLDIGLAPNSSSASRAIGYRQAMEYLLHCRHMGGQCSPGDLYSFLSEFQKASRNFAKRQVTWFRNEYLYKWLDASKPLEQVLDFIYHDVSGNLLRAVPQSRRMIEMDAASAGRRESYELRSYRPQNRVFVREEDCFHILEWIRKTQLR